MKEWQQAGSGAALQSTAISVGIVRAQEAGGSGASRTNLAGYRLLRNARRMVAAVLWGLCAHGAGATAVGGEGVLPVVHAVGNPVACFATRAPNIPQVCGKAQIRWRLSALMGEPVAYFGLAWSAESVQLRTAQNGQTSVRSYAVSALPPALAQAAARTELTVYALGSFIGDGGRLLAVDVDTGAPAAADGQVSLNVPGSPDWGRFILSGGSSVGVDAGLHGGPRKSWCAPEGRTYLPADHAKAEMRRGLRLAELMVCPRTSANADALARAIERNCADAPGAAWCPRPTTPAQTDVLDRVAEAPAVRSRHKAMVEAFRKEATAACEQEQAPVLACLRQGCTAPAGPDVQACRSVPKPPVLVWSGCLGDCDAYDARHRKAFETKKADWDTRWSDMSRQCSESRTAHEVHAQCVRSRADLCNPKGLNVQQCVDRRMALAPSEAAARAAYDSEAAVRSSGRQRPTFLD